MSLVKILKNQEKLWDTKNDRYNGWTNWDTWNASLHLTNDETIYKCLMMCNDHHGVSGIFNEFFPDSIDDIDTSKVNWKEIFDNL